MSHVEQRHAVANCDDRSAVGGEAGRCVRTAWKTKSDQTQLLLPRTCPLQLT